MYTLILLSLLQGQNEYIGMLMVSPVVRMTHDTQEPVLEWFPVFRYNKSAGEILAAFELIHVMFY